MRQGCSEARTHSPIQAKPEDSQAPTNELQKLGNGVSMQPPRPGVAQVSLSPGMGGAVPGVSSSQICVLRSCKEK